MDTKSLSLSLFFLLCLSLNLTKVHSESLKCRGTDCIFPVSFKNVNEAMIVRKEVPESTNTPEDTASNSNSQSTTIPSTVTTSPTNADITTVTTSKTTSDTTLSTNPDTVSASTATPAQDNENSALGLAPFTLLLLSVTFLISAL